MSARITVSYETAAELAAIRQQLAPLISHMSVYSEKKPFKKAYIWLKTTPQNSGNPDTPKDCA